MNARTHPADLFPTLFGCACDLIGVALGVGLVIAAVASDPTRVMAMTPGDDAASLADYLWCFGPVVIIAACWSLARRLIILRLVAGFILGFYGAVVVLGIVLFVGQMTGAW